MTHFTSDDDWYGHPKDSVAGGDCATWGWCEDTLNELTHTIPWDQVSLSIHRTEGRAKVEGSTQLPFRGRVGVKEVFCEVKAEMHHLALQPDEQRYLGTRRHNDADVKSAWAYEYLRQHRSTVCHTSLEPFVNR
jgi:hypothetical protein